MQTWGQHLQYWFHQIQDPGPGDRDSSVWNCQAFCFRARLWGWRWQWRSGHQCRPLCSLSIHPSISPSADSWCNSGVHSGRQASVKLPNDWETLLPGSLAEELWFWFWFLHPQQQEHMWTHLWVPPALRGPHPPDGWTPLWDPLRQLLLCG